MNRLDSALNRLDLLHRCIDRYLKCSKGLFTLSGSISVSLSTIWCYRCLQNWTAALTVLILRGHGVFINLRIRYIAVSSRKKQVVCSNGQFSSFIFRCMAEYATKSSYGRLEKHNTAAMRRLVSS